MFHCATIVVFLGFLNFFFFFLGISGNGLYMRDLRLKIFLVYKWSLRDSISRWTPRGKNATLDYGNRVFETRFIGPKSSLLNSKC